MRFVVSAEIAGLREGEQALLIYSTADGQSVEQAIPLTRSEGDYRHQCRFPPGNLGLQQDCDYHLAAGDYRTRRYHVEAQIAPAIAVDKVTYHYPAYAAIADRTVLRQGDLQGLEGTEVTLYTTANTKIKPGTAEIDLGCTGRRGVNMTTDGATAIGRFTLRAGAKDAAGAEYDSYQLRFADGRWPAKRSPHPLSHRRHPRHAAGSPTRRTGQDDGPGAGKRKADHQGPGERRFRAAAGRIAGRKRRAKSAQSSAARETKARETAAERVYGGL